MSNDGATYRMRFGARMTAAAPVEQMDNAAIIVTVMARASSVVDDAPCAARRVSILRSVGRAAV